MYSICRNNAYLKSENGENGCFGHILDFFAILSLEIGPWKWAGLIRLNRNKLHIYLTRWRILLIFQLDTKYSYFDLIVFH